MAAMDMWSGIGLVNLLHVNHYMRAVSRPPGRVRTWITCKRSLRGGRGSETLSVQTPAGLNEFQLNLKTDCFSGPSTVETDEPLLSATVRIDHTSFALSGKQPQTFFFIYFFYWIL